MELELEPILGADAVMLEDLRNPIPSRRPSRTDTIRVKVNTTVCRVGSGHGGVVPRIEAQLFFRGEDLPPDRSHVQVSGSIPSGLTLTFTDQPQPGPGRLYLKVTRCARGEDLDAYRTIKTAAANVGLASVAGPTKAVDVEGRWVSAGLILRLAPVAPQSLEPRQAARRHFAPCA